MAFGVIVQHLFGPVVGSPAIFALVAMGGVFGGAAQAPLTAIASVVEMTGNYGLTLPVMLAVAIAAAVSNRLSYGSIYTTKLLRRGIDIERPKPASVLQTLTVADVMLPPFQGSGGAGIALQEQGGVSAAPVSREVLAELVGVVTATRQPQALLADETLEQALRQLTLYGGDGLPVLSSDREHLMGWITRRSVLQAIAAGRLSSSIRDVERGALAAESGADDADSRLHTPSSPLDGYEIVEISISRESPALGRRLGELPWPPGYLVVAVTERREIGAPQHDSELRVGERVILLAPAASMN
jgi:CIC family chloride channel protein